MSDPKVHEPNPPLGAWEVVDLVQKETDARGIVAGYQLLLAHLESLTDNALVYPVIPNVKLPPNVTLHPRISEAMKFIHVRETFFYLAGSGLDFGRSAEDFRGVLEEALRLPKPLAVRFFVEAANPGHWRRCSDLVAAEIFRLDSAAAPLDDEIFNAIHNTLAPEAVGRITAKMMRRFPADASQRMKTMVGKALLRTPDLELAAITYIKTAVDPTLLEGANSDLCTFVRIARATAPASAIP
jgi:hypothetical protein